MGVETEEEGLDDEGKGVDGPAIVDGPGSPASEGGGEVPAALALVGPAPGVARRAMNASSRESVFIVDVLVLVEVGWNECECEVLARQHGMPVAGIVRSLTDGVEWCEGTATLRMRDARER